jgi:hypothetical protein
MHVKLTAYWTWGKPPNFRSRNFCFQLEIREFKNNLLRRILGPTKQKNFRAQEIYCIMWTALLSKFYFGDQIKEDKMVLACGIYWGEDKYMNETDPLEDIGVDGSMITDFKEQDGRVWTVG